MPPAGVMNYLPDAYARRAQMKPALFVALPLAISVFSFVSGEIEKWVGMWTAVWTLFGWFGGAILIAQLGRDMGRRKQDFLYKQWGGAPTTKLLRHRDAPNQAMLKRAHYRLQLLMPGTRLPSPAEESENPESADETYETCTAFLREQTRDTKEYRLVFEELCNYGFRRNLWGMKPVGIITTLLGLAAVITFSVLHLLDKVALSFPSLVISAALLVILLLAWLLVFKPGWVKVPAEAYAIQLLSAIDKLEPQNPLH